MLMVIIIIIIIIIIILPLKRSCISEFINVNGKLYLPFSNKFMELDFVCSIFSIC